MAFCRFCHALAQLIVTEVRSIFRTVVVTLRKHAYSNILKILPPKIEKFRIKYSDIFHISAQNVDCWYSLEPPRRAPTIYVFEQK